MTARGCSVALCTRERPVQRCNLICAAGEGHHRSSHADQAPTNPLPPQQQQEQQQFAHQHPHQPRSQAPQGPGQVSAAPPCPLNSLQSLMSSGEGCDSTGGLLWLLQEPACTQYATAPLSQKAGDNTAGPRSLAASACERATPAAAPPPPQQQQQQPGVQRLQFGQLGSPPGYSRDEGRQPPLPTDLHLPNGHLSTPPSGECWVGGACSEELVLIGVDFLLGLPEVCCDNVTRLQHIRSQ